MHNTSTSKATCLIGKAVIGAFARCSNNTGDSSVIACKATPLSPSRQRTVTAEGTAESPGRLGLVADALAGARVGA